MNKGAIMSGLGPPLHWDRHHQDYRLCITWTWGGCWSQFGNAHNRWQKMLAKGDSRQDVFQGNVCGERQKTECLWGKAKRSNVRRFMAFRAIVQLPYSPNTIHALTSTVKSALGRAQCISILLCTKLYYIHLFVHDVHHQVQDGSFVLLL